MIRTTINNFEFNMAQNLNLRSNFTSVSMRC